MRSSRFALLAALPALAFGVAACGDDDEDTAAGGATTAAETEAAPAADAAGEDIVALAQGNEDLSTLVQAVTAAELVETLQGEGPYTVFAPTNDAFAALPDGTLDDLLLPENQDQLTEILTYHVVPQEAMAADLQDGQTLTTVQGDELQVSVDGDTVMINDATVTTADVDASNGVVHVIDGVLTPPES